MTYLSLFFAGFIAATLFPASSEIFLLALFQQGYIPWLLWLAATAGNTLGSCVNWYLGREILRLRHKRWFPVTAEQLQRAEMQFKRYGIWSLLLAWLPVVGDPLTFIAGSLRVRFDLFFVLVAIGKGLRYAALIFLASRFL
ncbi:MAG: YqaA family protein [Pseudohongiella sp.]|nr:YqaA family protein [Pseudohongiella sp.]MDO9519267.1 YqaA family protein [Pseudohongiella sp.]MDP2126122.1 YqaA family protein [Pseudohongiella sp.]